MNASELYEQLVTSIADSMLGEEVRGTAPGGIKILRLSADEASARKPKAPMELSDTAKSHLGELRAALDSGKVTRRDGSVVNMHPEIRKRVQAEHDRIVGAMGGNPLVKGREAAAKALDSIMVAPEPEVRKPTGAEAFNALFK